LPRVRAGDTEVLIWEVLQHMKYGRL